jgi:hypothetical protein
VETVHPEDMHGPQEENYRGVTVSDKELTGSRSEYEWYETDEIEDGVSIIEIEHDNTRFQSIL